MKLSNSILVPIFIGIIILADQIIKIWTKTHLFLYEDRCITNWFHIFFVENNGMAMGLGMINGLFLSIFRILISFIIVYFLFQLIKKNAKLGHVLCIAMIFAGSIGNIIDNVFYRVFFSESSPNNIAIFSYSKFINTWLHGKVVDMFYFPLFRFTWPEKIPFIGGSQFLFFRYIFNIADVSITLGVVILFIFYRDNFSESVKKCLHD